MPTAEIQTDRFREAFERLRASEHDAPAVLLGLRERAMQRFETLGLPHTKQEAWRFTNPAPITKAVFEDIDPAMPAPRPEALDPFRFGGISGQRLVLIDGRYHAELSDTSALPAGVTVMSLAEAIRREPELIETHFGTVDRPDEAAEEDVFSVLNAALAADGMVLCVADGVRVERPVHLMCLTTATDRPRATHIRQLVAVGRSAEVTLIENHASLGHGVFWTNSVTEVAVGPNANVRHYRLDRYNEQSINVGTLAVDLQRDAHFESHAVLLGSGLVRNNIRAKLLGENAQALLNGLYLPHQQQHVDTHILVTHAAPNCNSRQYYKGVLDDRSRGVFAGRIIVEEDAQKTNAEQSNRNLLLSEEARADSMPQLEIYADDVRCTHGSTTGQLDRDAAFYLMARGIDEDTARGLLIWAFAHESLDRMTVAPIRQKLEASLLTRLPQGAALADLIETESDA